MSDKDGGNVSVLNERMMLGWHVANPGHQHQYSLDGKLGDQFAKSAWAALRKLNSASYTIPQVVELMRKNGMPDTSPDKFQAEILSPIEKWGMPDPITTYNLLNELWQRREGVSLIDLYRDQILWKDYASAGSGEDSRQHRAHVCGAGTNYVNGYMGW